MNRVMSNFGLEKASSAITLIYEPTRSLSDLSSLLKSPFAFWKIKLTSTCMRVFVQSHHDGTRVHVPACDNEPKSV